MNLHSYDLALPFEELVVETRRAVASWDWGRGAYGHALSLPKASELHPHGRYSYGNYPCTGMLDGLPRLRGVFDSLRCEKVSFRLLRRGAGSSYAWHTDRWKGPGVVRFQIPILADAESVLVLTDYESPEDLAGAAPLSPAAAAAGTLPAGRRGHVRIHRMDPGVLYYFDTTRVHTLVNRGASERLTLSFDLVANDWLLERFPAIRAELGGGTLATLPRPGRLPCALGYVRSRFHPLRSLARRMLSAGAAGAES